MTRRISPVQVVFFLVLAVFLRNEAVAQDRTPAADARVPTWSLLKAAYDYEKDETTSPRETATDLRDVLKRANAALGSAGATAEQLEEPDELPNVLALQLTFGNSANENCPGLFVRPGAEGIYPCALLLHGYGGNKETVFKHFGLALVKRGIAVLALDAPESGARRAPNRQPEYARVLRDGIPEYRRALDYLSARKDIDAKRVGLLGNSLGAMQGVILGAVDERIRVCVLCVGGELALERARETPEESRDAAYALCPSLYVPHIAPRPTLMINAKRDTVVSKEATQRLYDAAKQPKQLLWADSGHILPRRHRMDAAEWLAERLKTREP